MNVVFIEPAFPSNQREFVRALHGIGATVIGIGERPAEALDGELRHWLAHYEQIDSVVQEASLLAVIGRLHRQIGIERVEATVEAHILPAAKVRETLDLPGTSVRTAFLCRDKPAMKQTLREAGIPCARSTRIRSVSEAARFAADVGYPLIVKPPAGAGAAGTVKVSNDEELTTALSEAGVESGGEAALEEFVEGHEGYLDTITIGGEVRHEFITHYYPNVLEAMRTRWISPQMVTTNRLDAPGYAELKDMARRVIGILGIETSPTHMEWFAGPRGLRFSEIGCRPPGVCQWDVYNAANEFDIYTEWASAIVHGRSLQSPSRRYAAGMIALRPERDGLISGYSGVDEIQRRFGHCIVAAHLPAPGTPTQPVEAGYMANAWIRARHPDYDELRRILDSIGETIKVHAD